MAGSKKNKKAAARRRAQQRQSHQAAKSRDRAHQQTHLPKAGTAEDDAYLMRRSREDVLDFGLAAPKRGPLLWVSLAVVAVIVVIGFIGWIILT